MSDQQPTIVIDKLSKKYDRNQNYALHNLSLNIFPGEVYGFLGPNGAGKSTTIRLLMDFIRPTEGKASILGYDSLKQSLLVKQNVGYLSGDSDMYLKMTGRKFLKYMSELQPAVSKKYTAELTSRLKADLNKPLGSLSRGNRQKIALIQALMHQPKILILDEPTSGLDPLMQDEFYLLIKEAKQRGATVFMSSHILSEVQKVCDKVGIIRSGKLVGEQSIEKLAIEAAQTFVIRFASKPPLKELKRLAGVKKISVQKDGSVILHVHSGLSELFTILGRHEVSELNTLELNLEDQFMQYYQSPQSDQNKSTDRGRAK
ncbi:MAG TPA: ABC transporter ATP-binding protein [Candidatus Saccharibacteria bacterium]|nr:ABC transporter ATP-binding protein [Candidatus Saccharibacteria bacterium]HMT39896.1 ABC transporter ATP-binding protein [Candidatus Saccharibacteria bacterium]